MNVDMKPDTYKAWHQLTHRGLADEKLLRFYFQLIFSEVYLMHFSVIIQLACLETPVYFSYVFGFGLVSPGNKPWPVPVLINLDVDIHVWLH